MNAAPTRRLAAAGNGAGQHSRPANRPHHQCTATRTSSRQPQQARTAVRWAA
jgi:hypothetical protein